MCLCASFLDIEFVLVFDLSVLYTAHEGLRVGDRAIELRVAEVEAGVLRGGMEERKWVW
jgi:hypothetical protein